MATEHGPTGESQPLSDRTGRYTGRARAGEFPAISQRPEPRTGVRVGCSVGYHRRRTARLTPGLVADHRVAGCAHRTGRELPHLDVGAAWVSADHDSAGAS